ncbi:hypothetical protein [Halosimplex halophilum]|uniref:hypothetical protein n=1 Tax=Halosimplex halophilum TaxID=2559572 RepID=UPI00107FD2A2|nr:hypothetical protein [Halosimplex halophilum]
MSPSVRESLRTEIDHWWVLAVVAAAGLFAGALDATAAELGVVLAVLHAEKGATVAEAAGAVREWVAEAASALAAVGGAGALLALGSDPSLVFIVLFAGVRSGYGAAKAGLAAHESARDGPSTATDRAGSATDRTGPTDRAVLAALEDQARTRRELREAVGDAADAGSGAVDADDEAVDAALDRLRDRGAVERAGSEYRAAPDPDPGFVERLRSLVPGRGRATDRGRASSGTPGGAGESYEAGLSSVTSNTDRSGGADSGRELAGLDADRGDGSRAGGTARERVRGRDDRAEYERTDGG